MGLCNTNAMHNQKITSRKKIILNPRQIAKSPPRLAIKSIRVILLWVWYSEHLKMDYTGLREKTSFVMINTAQNILVG